MKKNIILITVVIFSLLLFISCEKGEIKEQTIDNIELSKYEYVDVKLPYYLDRRTGHLPSSNEAAALGRILFYDVNLSLNNSISCGSCHQQSKSFSDGKAHSAGLFDKKTKRNTISLVNCGTQSVFLWDNQKLEMEDVVMKPISDHIEMGIADVKDVAKKLQQIEYYPALFEKAFGTSEITTENISFAMAQFVKSLYSYNSKYDRGEDAEYNNFSISELRGKELFFGKAACSNCHNDRHFMTKWGNSHNIGLDIEYSDKGFASGKFKVPTLRNIGLTAPYMHDGRFSTLKEVINHYNVGIKPHPYLSFYLREGFQWNKGPIKLNLSDRDTDDLEAFLNTLTDYDYLNEVKYSDPFN